jgi:hypothetical protein
MTCKRSRIQFDVYGAFYPLEGCQVIPKFCDPSFRVKQLLFDASQFGFVCPSTVSIVHIIPKKHPRRLASLLKARSKPFKFALGIRSSGAYSLDNAR